MTSAEERFQNLLKIGELKAEPPDQHEIDGLVRSAENRLTDAKNAALSSDSRFSLAYDAAHSLALAALRRCGYRAKNRHIVFQLLGETLSIPTAKRRFLENCHARRNVALYDGHVTDDEAMIRELVKATEDLLKVVKAYGPTAS